MSRRAARRREVRGQRGPRSHRSRFVRAAAWMALTWALCGVLLGFVALSTDGEFTRLKVMTVLSGSMRPTLGVGDLIVAHVVPARDIEAGDIVTYQDPAKDRHVTHRVQSIVWNGSLADVVTRGDANDVGENWVVTEEGRLGRVVFHLPGAGYMIGALGTMAGRIAVAAAALVLGAYAMLLIWRPRREDRTRQVQELYANAVWFAAVAAPATPEADGPHDHADAADADSSGSGSEPAAAARHLVAV